MRGKGIFPLKYSVEKLILWGKAKSKSWCEKFVLHQSRVGGPSGHLDVSRHLWHIAVGMLFQIVAGLGQVVSTARIYCELEWHCSQTAFFFSALPITPEKRHDNTRKPCDGNRHESLQAEMQGSRQQQGKRLACIQAGWGRQGSLWGRSSSAQNKEKKEGCRKGFWVEGKAGRCWRSLQPKHSRGVPLLPLLRHWCFLILVSHRLQVLVDWLSTFLIWNNPASAHRSLLVPLSNEVFFQELDWSLYLLTLNLKLGSKKLDVSMEKAAVPFLSVV